MAALDLSTTTIADLVSALEKGLPALLGALEVVEKFDLFLPASVQAEIATAVKILTAVQSLVSKV